jgi:hypothetical protein
VFWVIGPASRILAGLPPADSSAPEKTPCSCEAKHSVPVPGSNHTIEYEYRAFSKTLLRSNNNSF